MRKVLITLTLIALAGLGFTACTDTQVVEPVSNNATTVLDLNYDKAAALDTLTLNITSKLVGVPPTYRTYEASFYLEDPTEQATEILVSLYYNSNTLEYNTTEWGDAADAEELEDDSFYITNITLTPNCNALGGYYVKKTWKIATDGNLDTEGKYLIVKFNSLVTQDLAHTIDWHCSTESATCAVRVRNCAGGDLYYGAKRYTNYYGWEIDTLTKDCWNADVGFWDNSLCVED